MYGGLTGGSWTRALQRRWEIECVIHAQALLLESGFRLRVNEGDSTWYVELSDGGEPTEDDMAMLRDVFDQFHLEAPVLKVLLPWKGGEEEDDEIVVESVWAHAVTFAMISEAVEIFEGLLPENMPEGFSDDL